MTRITKHLVNLQERIRLAAARAGRNENDVSILAVSKRQNVAAVHEAFDAGLRAMGENYVQEALEKQRECDPAIEWHFIGRVQANKTRALAEHFDWVQTVASERVARRLAEQRPDGFPPLNVCVQVCIDESDHGGVAPADAEALCRTIASFERLRLRGLMAIPAATEDPEEQRAPFRRLRTLYDEIVAEGLPLDTLSMGMTNDLEAAIMEGSTMVRIGTALFGPRPS